jgi:hypothetical protein
MKWRDCGAAVSAARCVAERRDAAATATDANRANPCRLEARITILSPPVKKLRHQVSRVDPLGPLVLGIFAQGTSD